MGHRSLFSLCALCALGSTLIAQGRGQGAGSGSTLAPPAVYPHDMSAYGCTHFDDKTCDTAPTPSPMYDPLIGQWVRFTLIRNGFSVQPPDAPLYRQFGPDGYWSMMEFPANRPKINKPLDQQTPQELLTRFDASDGGWGTYTQDGMINDRHHYSDVAAPGNGGAEHVRAWRFEGHVLVLEGTGSNHSPEIKTRKLPVQTLTSRAIVGAYERTTLTVSGAPVQQIVPQHLLLGEDGWFQETVLPINRPRPQAKPMDQWTTEEFAAAYKGVEAARGTYNADSSNIIRKHIGDLDPNLEGKDAIGTYTLQGGTLTITGTSASGQHVQETFTKMKPYDVYPLTRRPPARAAPAEAPHNSSSDNRRRGGHMKLRRREFLGTALAAGAAALSTPGMLRAQDDAAAGGGRGNAPPTPTYVAKVEKLYKSPDRYPNALEAMPDGLWVGDQVSERVLKLDWQTGKVLVDFIAEAHNTSGLAVGGGYLWIGCNGGGTAATTRPFNRPFDKNYGEIVQCDMKTGKQVKGYRTPWGSQHGTSWAKDTDKLWAVAPGMGFAAELDPKDDLRVLRMVSIGGGTPHGIEVLDGSLWIMYAADRVVKKFDMSGKVLELWKLAPGDPDPHGMCIHDGFMYYCDAGLGGGRTPSPGTVPQQICRFPLAKT